MTAAENKCPVCEQMVDDDHYLPIADKCIDCYKKELDAINDEIDELFCKYCEIE